MDFGMKIVVLSLRRNWVNSLPTDFSLFFPLSFCHRGQSTANNRFTLARGRTASAVDRVRKKKMISFGPDQIPLVPPEG